MYQRGPDENSDVLRGLTMIVWGIAILGLIGLVCVLLVNILV